jgi:WD40 repeat protein
MREGRFQSAERAVPTPPGVNTANFFQPDSSGLQAMEEVCMTTKELPPQPSLDQYRKQAKDLLKRYQAGDPDALLRIRQYHPQFKKTVSLIEGGVCRLSDAQWVVAREHGFESWPKFASHIRGIAAANSATSGTTHVDAAFALDLDIKTDELNACAFTRDGRRALTGAGGNPAGLWDVETGRCVMAFDARTAGAWAVAWSHDERHAFVGTLDGSVQMWDVEQRLCVRVLTVHHDFVRCLVVSADGRRALSGSGGRRDPSARWWDLESGHCDRIMHGHSDGLYDVAIDPAHRRALSGSRDGTIRLWDLENGNCLRVFKGHTDHVHSLAWSADQRRILSSSTDIRLWDVESGRCLRVFDQDHTDTIRKVLWSADQRRALSAAHDGTVRLWDVESGHCLRVLRGHPVGVVTVAWSPDERRAWSCDWNGGIRGWDLT